MRCPHCNKIMRLITTPKPNHWAGNYAGTAKKIIICGCDTYSSKPSQAVGAVA